jgi:hypothetical protein
VFLQVTAIQQELDGPCFNTVVVEGAGVEEKRDDTPAQAELLQGLAAVAEGENR